MKKGDALSNVVYSKNGFLRFAARSVGRGRISTCAHVTRTCPSDSRRRPSRALTRPPSSLSWNSVRIRIHVVVREIHLRIVSSVICYGGIYRVRAAHNLRDPRRRCCTPRRYSFSRRPAGSRGDDTAATAFTTTVCSVFRRNRFSRPDRRRRRRRHV